SASRSDTKLRFRYEIREPTAKPAARSQPETVGILRRWVSRLIGRRVSPLEEWVTPSPTWKPMRAEPPARRTRWNSSKTPGMEWSGKWIVDQMAISHERASSYWLMKVLVPVTREQAR